MKIYGWAISHEFGQTTLAYTNPEGALELCAEWCKKNWTGADSYPAEGTDQEIVDAYVEAHQNEQLDEFDTDLGMDVNDLREAYCAAIDAGHTLDGDHDWINEQMAALNEALPSEWYVHSSAELDELCNPLSVPETFLAESPIDEPPPIDDAAWDPVWTAFALRHEARSDELTADCSPIDLAAFEAFIEPGRIEMETAYELIDGLPHVAGWTSSDYQFWVYDLWPIGRRQRVIVIEDQPYCGCYCLPPLREWPNFWKGVPHAQPTRSDV